MSPPRLPKLLFVTQTLPYPLSDGGNIRSFKIVEALSEAFQVTLIGSAHDPAAVESASHPLRRLCRKVVCVPDAKNGSVGFHLRVLAQVVLRGRPPRHRLQLQPRNP